MANKLLGLILLIAGALGIALLFEPVKSFLNLPLAKYSITDTTLTIAGVVLVIIGIFILKKSSAPSQKNVEVPIYKGKQIVGYRKL